ncbi:LuxR family transcriptional regulator [Rhodococcus sp. 14C212]|uniref:LuxR C-terminal-related transcriptional regulator n=1 Tax=Rhodococcus sp. 14C212 TaxID=2711209 RepID=UPI0013E9FE8D|nr:LuxR C-terminal-related transcriptional regulator [Rhodococcus sp. 14C212]NGP08283.1 LuxR family transcriptional regulator [Rhodococcus sp. 14C212]
MPQPASLPRDIAHAVAATPPRLLLTGPAGSGKSALLSSVRQTLAGRGLTVGADPCSPPSSALVVDDAHTLPAESVLALAEQVRRGERPVVVATEPRPHRGDLRALLSAFGAHSALVELRPLSPREIAGRAATLGLTPRPEPIRAVHRLTGGARDVVDAALAALRDGTDPRRAAAARVRDRLGGGDPDLPRVLVLAGLGGTLDPLEVATVLGVDADRARELVDAARASGLLTVDGDVPIPAAAAVPAAVLGTHAVRTLAHRLAALRLDAGLLTADAARALAEAGVADARLADLLVTLADAAEPAQALPLYDAAIRAGADADALDVRRAEAAGLAGDLATAGQLTDRLLDRAATLPAGELAAATRIAATVAARRGMLGRSADLYEWLGPERAGADAPIAATVLLAAGRPDPAARFGPEAFGTEAAAPTSSAAAAQLLAAGLRESVGGDGRVAMNTLTRALSVHGAADRTRLLPDTPEAITALLCLHSGELAHAGAVLGRATAAPSVRHRLLSAWTALIGGDLPAATSAADELAPHATEQRDLLFLHGLRVGLARRGGDVGALTAAWTAAQGVVAEYSVDLLSLLPLGELWLAAVRLGEADRIAHLVGQAQDLLTTLGEPPLWGATLHWYGVQAAIAADRPAELLPHARALGSAAETTAYAAALARAGQAWLRVLQGDAGPTRVQAAAESLAAIGLPWDGARLAGEAALRVDETATATTLLQVARAVRHPSAAPRTAAPAPAADAPAAASPLSDREAEVADLVVAGLTYREVGSRLYISAKTVEHHVARIRRRLGAGSRSELISMLRALGHGTEVRQPGN